MSTFDVNNFQNAQFTEANATEFTPVPAGEFIAVIDKFNIRTPKESVILDVTWKIDDPQVAEETGMPNPSVRQSIFLDVNEAGGLEFGKGKNVSLGRLREALGQNTSGLPWSFGMLVGQVAKIRVAHRIDNENITRADVTGVSKA